MGALEAADQAVDRRAFRNRRAKTLPRYSPNKDGREVRMPALAKERSATFKGAEIHDVAFRSMTPAPAGDAGKRIIPSLRGAAVVFIGRNGPTRSEVMKRLFERRKAAPRAFGDIPETGWRLEDRKVAYEAVGVDGRRMAPISLEDLPGESLDTLSSLGVEADPGVVSELLEAFKRTDGTFLEVADYKVETLLWRN